jgi:hypothetical protein
MSCGTLGLNILAKWLVHLKDLRLKTLVIDESVQIKQLMHMYIGLISVGVAGEYMVKLVAACPKKSEISQFNLELTHLAITSQKHAIVKTNRILDISSLRRPRPIS